MQKLFTRSLIFFCLTTGLLLAEVERAWATHSMAADLSYKCLDTVNHIYLFTYTFYRDCAGIEAPLTVSLNISSSCSGAFSATLNQVPPVPNAEGGQPGEVSPLCPMFIDSSTCNTGSYPGVEQFVYTGIITLPAACADWTFYVDIGSRNVAITNLQNPGGQDMYIQATLNNLLAPGNSSPIFTTLPVPFICVYQSFSYNQGAFNADGDSLVYSLVDPLGAGGVPIPYNYPYTAIQPMSVSGSFGFNSMTGEMNFTPNFLQIAVVTVLVQEYRNGQLVGSTMRDMQFVVVNLPSCSNPPPGFSQVMKGSLQGGYFIDSSDVQVCQGNTISFSTSAFSSLNDSVFLSSNVGQTIPAAQFNTSYLKGDSVIGIFNWPTTSADTGYHTFIVTVKNNNCPLISNQSYAITIFVLNGTHAGPDVSYCPSGGPVQLHATGGTQFTWTPSTGLSNDSISSPTAAPAQTTSYVVTSNLSSNCGNKDTVVVTRVPGFNYSLTPLNDTICLYGAVSFNLSPDTTQGPYTYQWSPPTGLNFTNIPNPIASPGQTTNYTVLIKSQKTGCAETDQARVNIMGVGPQVILTADKNKVCLGDTIHLSSLISTVDCGLGTGTCSGPSNNLTSGTGNVIDPSDATPYDGLYMAGRIQMLYQASELRAIGMKPGTITAIAFDIADIADTFAYHNFTIRMGCTDNTFLNTFVPGLSQVMLTNDFTPSGTGWNTHTFNTPYDWDGLSNLIIDICFTNNTDYSQQDVYATSTAYNSVVYASMDYEVGCNLTGAITPVYTSNNRPNTMFSFCPAQLPPVTHQWAPTTNLFVPDSLDPYVVLSQNTTYLLTVADSNCQGAGNITLTIDSSFGISAGPDLSYCNGPGVQLGVALTGSPPRVDLTCGTNGPACSSNAIPDSLVLPGAFSSANTPFIGDSLNERTQILYLASELKNAGFTSGIISRVGFKLDSKASSKPYSNLNISLGCTNKSQLDDYGWESTNLVYTSPAYNTVSGWNDFALQNTFDWDGASNLVVEICWSNPDTTYQTGSDNISSQTATYTALHTGAGSGISGCAIPVPTLDLVYELPEMRVQMCLAPVLPLTYRWSPSTGLSNDTVASPFASPAQTTLYQVTTYFGGRCPKTDDVLVSHGITNFSVSPDTIICTGSSAQLLATGGSSYTWQSTSGGLSCTTCSDPIVNPVSGPAVYYVDIVDSAAGCTLRDSVIVNVHGLSVVPVFSDTTVKAGDTITLAVNVTGGNPPYSYIWSPATYMDSINSANPTAMPMGPITYTVSVTSGPCGDTASINVSVTQLPDSLIMPTGFTPNGDGRNDNFGPVASMLYSTPTIKIFRIYNRWGQMVFNGNTYWDGKFDGKDQPVGTYIYYIEVQYAGSNSTSTLTYKKEGSVTLLR